MASIFKTFSNFVLTRQANRSLLHRCIFSATAQQQVAKMASTSDKLLGKDEVAAMRINYKSQGLKFDELEKKEPFYMFDLWFKMAKDCTMIKEPNSMAIATASADGKPSVRIVLLKGYDETGFRFFTNYNSKKGKEIEQNPNVALLFYWEPLERQIRIEGRVERLSDKVSTEYFHTRPRASQLGAAASLQSTVVPNKEFLEQKYADLEKKYEGKEIPKPEYWGGYHLKPDLFEFWCGGKGRMHDRVVFRLPETGEEISEHTKTGDNGWLFEFLSP